MKTLISFVLKSITFCIGSCLLYILLIELKEITNFSFRKKSSYGTRAILQNR